MMYCLCTPSRMLARMTAARHECTSQRPFGARTYTCTHTAVRVAASLRAGPSPCTQTRGICPYHSQPSAHSAACAQLHSVVCAAEGNETSREGVHVCVSAQRRHWRACDSAPVRREACAVLRAWVCGRAGAAWAQAAWRAARRGRTLAVQAAARRAAARRARTRGAPAARAPRRVPHAAARCRRGSVQAAARRPRLRDAIPQPRPKRCGAARLLRVCVCATHRMMFSWSFSSCRNIISRNVRCGRGGRARSASARAALRHAQSRVLRSRASEQRALRAALRSHGGPGSRAGCVQCAPGARARRLPRSGGGSLTARKSNARRRRRQKRQRTCASVAFWNASKIFFSATVSPVRRSTAFHTMPYACRRDARPVSTLARNAHISAGF
jgi:hypothetical protein